MEGLARREREVQAVLEELEERKAHLVLVEVVEEAVGVVQTDLVELAVGRTGRVEVEVAEGLGDLTFPAELVVQEGRVVEQEALAEEVS